MLKGLKDNPEEQEDKDSNRPNLPLEFAISTVLILKAMLSLQEAKHLSTLEEQEEKYKESFRYIDEFEGQVSSFGFKESHLILLLKYSKHLL